MIGVRIRSYLRYINNIAYGNTDATKEEVIGAAKNFNFISTLWLN